MFTAVVAPGAAAAPGISGTGMGGSGMPVLKLPSLALVFAWR